jgi:hypothetical protein
MLNTGNCKKTAPFSAAEAAAAQPITTQQVAATPYA